MLTDELENEAPKVSPVEDFGKGGGARWKRARSWASVSRINAVMSCGERSAFVNALGLSKDREEMDEAQAEI